MPERDRYHGVVKRALVKDGWTITHDPFVLPFGEYNLFVDLGAETPIAAEREGRRIAVEIRSFLGLSPVTELERAVGQYALYDAVLAETEPERALYLAVSVEAHRGVFQKALGRLIVERQGAKLLVFDPEKEAIVEWVERPGTAR